MLESTKQIIQIAGMAQTVLAGNAWLASAMRGHGARTVLFPTVVDTEAFRPAAQPDEVYRLGWTGNPSTAQYLELIVEPVLASGAACLIVGAEQDAVPFDAECQPWRAEDEASQIHRCSAGLMPLPPTEWAEGKCALKALLFQACGRPVIATPSAAAAAAVLDGKTGFLAQRPDDWRDAIEQLRDPDLRRRMGAASRAHVEAEYSLHSWAPRLAEAIEAVA